MGRRGPKPTPKRILELRGSWRAKRNPHSPEPARDVPRCPSWLGKIAKKKYRDLARTLDALGVLTAVDGELLAAFAVAWEEFVTASQTLAEQGRVNKTQSGYMQPHPAVAMQRSAWAALQRFGALFGLDPSSRSRLEVSEPMVDPNGKHRIPSRNRG
jgi:P27 family predicted phage terminase small subunit